MRKIKFNSAALIMAGIFSVLAMLGLVCSVRNVVNGKAESFPPSNSAVSSMPSMYGSVIDITRYDSDESSVNSVNNGVSIAFPLSGLDGIGTTIYQGDSNGAPYYLSYNPTSTIYCRFDFRAGEANTWDNKTRIQYSYILGDTYCNERLYEHLFGGLSVTLGGATDYNFNNAISYEVNMTVLVFNPDTQLLEQRAVFYSGFSSGNNRFLEFNAPTFDEFVSEYGYNGMVCIRNFDLYFNIDYPYFLGYISFTLNHLSNPVSVVDFKSIQNAGAELYAPLSYRAVDDVGFEVIFNGINAFLNTEFIPGFRLWYFLLFGLGTSLLFFFLKTFLGG